MVGSYFAWLPLVWVVGTGVLFYVPVFGVVLCPLIVCGFGMTGAGGPRGGAVVGGGGVLLYITVQSLHHGGRVTVGWGFSCPSLDSQAANSGS